MSGPEHNSAEPIEPLTRRERDVLALLAQGHNGPEIAEELTLALSSVKWHTQHLYGKLGVNSKKQAIARARELGLLGAPVAAAETPAGPPGVRPPDAVQAAPTPAPQPERKHNLPLQVTRFFGREREVAQLMERLGENRLVTLTGSGGVGKTRLSLRTAEALLPDFADGVWLVELAPLSDPALVAQQAASSLGLRDDSHRPILETLTAFLRDRQLLLVLDNCEHLLEACGRLADTLLRACPGLRILASSREPLGIAGEAIFSVPSLDFPDPEHLPSIEKLDEYVSVRLFIDRARLVLPDYRVAAHNAASIAHICQRLDGIPLAIEMAAARLNILTAEQLAERLDDAFRLLTGGSRSALPRQQTLRAAVDWSYKLLSGPERLLFQRLSVFAGGCTLEAVEAVCAGEAIEAAEVLDLLASLVAKSMVVADRQSGVDSRYHLQEVMRQYAREKLNDSGDSERGHRQHRDYFILFAETSVPKISSSERLVWTRRLVAERENLRSALEWSFGDVTDVNAGPRLIDSLVLSYPWPSYQEPVNWSKKAFAWRQRHPEISDRVYASLLGQASTVMSVDEPQAALAGLTQAIDISRRLGPAGRKILMVNLFLLGSQHLQQRGDAASALGPLAEAEAILLELGPDGILPDNYLWIMAVFAGEKASLANDQGRYQDAKMLATESIRLFEESGDRWGGIVTRINLGNACLQLSEYEQARGNVLEALMLIEESADPQKAYALRWLAAVDWQQGQLQRALDYCRASLQEAAKLIDYNIIASCLGVSAGIAAKQDQLARSATLSGASAALWAKQGRKPWEDSSLDTLLPGWRETPDHETIQRALAFGQAMTGNEAMAYALSDEAQLGK